MKSSVIGGSAGTLLIGVGMPLYFYVPAAGLRNTLVLLADICSLFLLYVVALIVAGGLAGLLVGLVVHLIIRPIIRLLHNPRSPYILAVYFLVGLLGGAAVGMWPGAFVTTVTLFSLTSGPGP